MTPVYRMIHMGNLSKILDWGGDYAPNECAARGLVKQAIHHAHIMDRRSSRRVNCGPGGTLADYVPFYFRSRSPMLYAIQGGQVEGCADQREIFFLFTHAEKLVEAGLPFVFTDGHAVMAYAEYFDDISDLSKIPWDCVRAHYWNNYTDGKFRCQAEFLVRDFLPLQVINEIGVFDEECQSRVAEILSSRNITIDVSVRRSWYF